MDPYSTPVLAKYYTLRYFIIINDYLAQMYSSYMHWICLLKGARTNIENNLNDNNGLWFNSYKSL